MGKADRSRRSRGRANGKRLSKPTSRTRQRPSRQPPQISRAEVSKIGFGDLPAELRNLVYSYALSPNHGGSIRIVSQPPGLSKEQLALNLLCTCKAVRRESWSFLYEGNDFRIDCVKDPPRAVAPHHYVFIDGFGWHNTRRQNYTSHLEKFIACTKHKRALHSIRSISLAYHRKHPWDINGELDEQSPFPERADVVMNLRLVPSRPYYSLTFDTSLSLTSNTGGMAKAFDYYNNAILGMIDPDSGATKLSKILLEDITKRFYSVCLFHCGN